MKQSSLLLTIVVVGLLASQNALVAQHEHHQQQQATQAHEQEKELYTCSMHPDVVSEKPGKCPKCGMKLVKQSPSSQNISPVEKIKMAKTLLEEAKRGLKREGKYNCCIDTPCNQCALDHQSCPCYDELKAAQPVCNECYAGWQRGEGKDSSIKPSDVKTKFSPHHH